MHFQQLLRFTLIIFSTYIFFLTALDQYPSISEAAFYNNHSQQQWNVAYEALKKIEFQGSEAVLDIGCGSGKITANIAGRVGNGSVLGLDISEGMITFAQKNYQPLYSNVSFVREDILSLNSSSHFDYIFSSSSLHWILDHQQLLGKIYHLLKDQGVILFTIPCNPSPEVAAVFRDVTTQEPWQTYLKDYSHPRQKFTPEEYALFLKEAGFREIDIEKVPFTYHFETKRELVNWYAAFSPILTYIPSEMREAFLTNIIERYLTSFPLDKDGRVFFKQNELIIKARK